MAELVGNIPDDAVLQAQLDILYGQTPDITIKAHELPEESEPTVEKSGTLAEPVFDIGIPQAMGAVAAREYAKQAETARDAAIVAGETAKEELNGIVASADAALDQKITETGTLLDEKVATAAQRASEAASSAVAAAQKATAAEQAMQGAQAAQAQAEQSAQEAAENTAMAKDFASGQPVTYSGTPVSIAYAGAQRIASITAYGETPQGGTTETPVPLTGISSVTVNDDVTELPIPRPLRRVGDVRDVCVTRQEYEGTEKLVVTYNVGFVELDGTEDWKISVNKQKELIMSNFVSATTQKKQFCSHAAFEFNLSGAGFYIYENKLVFGANYTGKQLSLDEFKAYLAAQKAAGTPVQVAYQLAAPETYATDPLDIDNAAGPLTVMTGGEVEVRMTELVGSRSDVSNNTVAFVEVSQDADISSGEKLSVLFGKIKKRFSVLASTVMLKSVFTQVGNPNLLDNSDFTNPVNQRGVSGTISTAGYFIDRWKLVSGTVQITAEGLVLNGTISQILENAAGTDVTASASAGTASYDNSTKTFTLTATGQTITWAKLEKGSVDTPYVPKGYGAELLACQRYYVPIGENTKFFGGIGTAGNVAFVGMILPVQMRVTPSFTSDLNVVLRTVQGEQNIHGPVISKMTENNLAFTVTLNSGTTKSTPCVGYFYNERGLSADL